MSWAMWLRQCNVADKGGFFSLLSSMSCVRRIILSWNCDRFLRNVKELIQLHKPDILALMEPQQSGECRQSV